MNEGSSLLLNVIMTGVVILAFAVLWGLPIYLGLRWASLKGYSRLWMLFGIHPLGAWITAAVLQLVPPRTRCVNCGQFFNRQFLGCPYCGQPNANQQIRPAAAVKPVPHRGAEPAHAQATESIPPLAHHVAESMAADSQSPVPRSHMGTILIVTLGLFMSVFVVGCSGMACLVYALRGEPTPDAAMDIDWPVDRLAEPEPFGPIREFPANGNIVKRDDQLTRGQMLQAEWAGTWYLVEVREVLPDGNVKVYWSDWRDEEVLPRIRLQFASGHSDHP